MRLSVAVAYLDRKEWAGDTAWQSARYAFELLLRRLVGDAGDTLAAHCALLFESACFGIDMGIFLKQKYQILIMAFPAMILASVTVDIRVAQLVDKPAIGMEAVVDLSIFKGATHAKFMAHLGK